MGTLIDLVSCDVNHSPKGIIEHGFNRIESYIEYDTFFRNFMEANLPCILSKNFTLNWPARVDWVTSEGTPNIDNFVEHYGSSEVPVADCKQKHYDSQKKEVITMQNYIEYWKKLHSSDESKCLYLKDWHFVKTFPGQNVYQTLKYFASDWLNEFWEMRKDSKDDYRFVYLGPKSSWTPFHCDVFQSYSWSSNICGRKKWIFFPPGEEEKLKDKFGALPYDVTDVQMSNTSCVEVIQEAGETVFVPSGWHHQVWNLEDTLSINHNWINATNIDRVWEHLKQSLVQVEESIADCAGMDRWAEQCQLVLKATHGMDLLEYYCFLETIARRRIGALNDNSTLTVLDGHWQGRNHTMYDISKLDSCLDQLLRHPRLGELEVFDSLENHPGRLLDDLQDLL